MIILLRCCKFCVPPLTNCFWIKPRVPVTVSLSTLRVLPSPFRNLILSCPTSNGPPLFYLPHIPQNCQLSPCQSISATGASRSSI